MFFLESMCFSTSYKYWETTVYSIKWQFTIQGKTYIYGSELGQCMVFPDQFSSVEESLEILRGYDVSILDSLCNRLICHNSMSGTNFIVVAVIIHNV